MSKPPAGVVDSSELAMSWKLPRVCVCVCVYSRHFLSQSMLRIFCCGYLSRDSVDSQSIDQSFKFEV